ncbi:Erg28-like protein [Testicularia cyperi]|uniref:Erg28-like protein n=1 Tax=Testicularia cyperi TaxID=1882483 RepID=A0A317XRP7_9BASI|nr:Erg28-like protein [Testicularia cyperi]
MTSSASWVPAELLSKWLLLVSSMAIFNCVQNYIDFNFSRKVYTKGGASVTPLSARTFGVWNFTSAIIRGYGAYNIHNKVAYELCMWSFAIALGHFATEVFVFKTAKLTPGIISPLIVASSSLISMFALYGQYVR